MIADPPLPSTSPVSPEPVLLPVSKRPSRWLTRLAPLAVGALLVGGGGVFGLKALQGDSGSPEAPVQKLFDSLDKEDLVGVMESLTPGERGAIMGSTQRLAGELRRIGVAGDGFDLAHLQGVNFQVTNLKLDSTSVTDNLAEVRIVSGTLTTSVSLDSLPLGPSLRDLANQAGPDESAKAAEPQTEDLSKMDAPLMVVRKNGQWGLSLGYTLAEAARRDAGAARPDYAHPAVAPQGANSPSAAVEGLVGALDNADVRGMIAHLDPEEMAALYDYSSLFLPSADANVELKAFAAATTISDVHLSVEGSGDTRLVKIDGFTMSYDDDQVSADVRFENGCLHLTETKANGAHDTYDSCASGQANADALGADLGGFAGLQGLFDPTSLTKGLGITVHQVDGKWYVSPTRTVLESLVAVVGTLKDDAVGSIVQMFAGIGNA